MDKEEIIYDEQGRLYKKKGDSIEKLAIFSDHYYSLRVFNGIPILEIDGVRMHLIKNFKTPLEYAERVCKLSKINSKDIVLDTCGGLGYTAIQASKKAKKVISIEKSKEVLELGSQNPYSKDYFSNKNIERIKGDSFEEIKKFKENTFTKIIHDPPRTNFAPLLYSIPFYEQVKRVLKPQGLFYHYLGFVGRGRGRKIEESTKEKLAKMGFKVLKYDEKCYALISENKP